MESRTKDPEFYKKLFQKYVKGPANFKFPKFNTPVAAAKKFQEKFYLPKSPYMKYTQKYFNSCCFSSLVSNLSDYLETVSEQGFSKRIYKLLNCCDAGFVYRIDYEKAIMTDSTRNKI